MKPLISILIPAYNAEAFVADAIRSALGQTWSHKEIIVVDDGSTDATLAIARRFECKTVKVVTHDNVGAAASRNRALTLAQGDYIQWLDADDLLGAGKMARQMELVEGQQTPRTVMSCPFGQFRYRYWRAIFAPTALWQDSSPVDWMVRKLSGNLYMQTATWLVSRIVTDAAGPWNTGLLGDDDGEYFSRVILASNGVQFAPKASVFYRLPVRANLSFIGTSDRKMEAQFRSMCLTIEHLRASDDSDRVRRACVQYLQNWLPVFHPERPDIVTSCQRIATDLCGALVPPRMPTKYSWLAAACGEKAAKRVRVFAPNIRAELSRFLDKAGYWIESSSLAKTCGGQSLSKESNDVNFAETQEWLPTLGAALRHQLDAAESMEW